MYPDPPRERKPAIRADEAEFTASSRKSNDTNAIFTLCAKGGYKRVTLGLGTNLELVTTFVLKLTMHTRSLYRLVEEFLIVFTKVGIRMLYKLCKSNDWSDIQHSCSTGLPYRGSIVIL